MATPQTWQTWTRSATAIVRDIFASKRYLKAADVWRIGTEGTRPIMQPATAIDQHGRIRMKRVSNMREGRRIWIPPPKAPMPHHPFQAMRFLKSNILRALSAQNLIHQVRLPVPITDPEDLLEAERSAMRRYRRDLLEAKRFGTEPPAGPPPPRDHSMEYYWTLGPAPEKPVQYTMDEWTNHEPPSPAEIAEKMPDEGWARAEALEKAYHKAKALEDEFLEARKAVRKEQYAKERERAKRERAEMKELGMEGRLAQERRRQEAIASIEKYARQTGEDVSGWFEEVEKVELPDTPPAPYQEPLNPRRVGGKLRLTPDVPRKNPNKSFTRPRTTAR